MGCVYGCCTGVASSVWGAAPQDTLQALHGAGSWCVLEEQGSPRGWAGQVPLGRLRLPWAPPAPAPASCQPGPASQLPIPQPHKAQVLPDTKPGCLNLALLSPQFKRHLWQGWRSYSSKGAGKAALASAVHDGAESMPPTQAAAAPQAQCSLCLQHLSGGPTLPRQCCCPALPNPSSQ